MTDHRCFCYFTAAMFVPLRRAQTWRLHTKLYKFGWHTSLNNARMKNSRDCILCEVVCISIIYHIPNSWLYLLNQLRFLALITWQNRDWLFLIFLFWPGFQARKEPQSKSLRPYVLISVGILLFGTLVISAVITWYFWQKRKLKKSAPPRALIMDSIEQPGSSRKPRNEYVFLPQYWGVCLVTTLKPSRSLHVAIQSNC